MCACPGGPLLILHRVQANDASRILHDLAAGNVDPELVYCKIEEWDHITGSIRYGHGYPEVPLVERRSVLQGTEEDRAAQLRADQSRRHRGVHRGRRLPGALQDADRRQAGAGHRADQGRQAARPRRRRIPDRQQVGVPAQGRLRREVHHLQCRRRRSRRLHEPQRDRERSACLAGGHDHRRLRDGRDPGHHLRSRRISAGGASPEPRASSRRASMVCWATTFWAADSTSISTWWKARERLSAAKRRR